MLTYVTAENITAHLPQPISAGVDVMVTYVTQAPVDNALCMFAYTPLSMARRKRHADEAGRWNTLLI